MNVLIIEDDIQLNIAISELFKIKGIDPISVKDGLSALEFIDNGSFDLYIIDINIPNITGLELLQHIRKTDIDTPIIIITASLEIENMMTAFENGCSEYVKKPFHVKELDIRINHLISLNTQETILVRKELRYHFNTETFFYQNKPLHLRHKEKRFCAIVMKHINTIVPTETICDYVWEGEIKEYYPLRQLLTDLRKKLPFNIIETKIREGYMIETKN
ncbi:MAG: response regulator transcription factor [Campylobacterota bacterium]|nr:response regulator transcription factor [Campylobacterota bacterium]